jgi:rubredoxin
VPAALGTPGCHPADSTYIRLPFGRNRLATIVDHCSDAKSLDVSEAKTWMCLICGWIYDEAAGDEEHGIAPGTAWADVPMNWTCPECGARKEDFEMVQI